MRAYHRNPSLQRVIVFILVLVVYLEDELVIKFREGDSGVSIELLGVLREA